MIFFECLIISEDAYETTSYFISGVDSEVIFLNVFQNLVYCPNGFLYALKDRAFGDFREKCETRNIFIFCFFF